MKTVWHYFHYTDWFIWILIMAYYNTHNKVLVTAHTTSLNGEVAASHRKCPQVATWNGGIRPPMEVPYVFRPILVESLPQEKHPIRYSTPKSGTWIQPGDIGDHFTQQVDTGSTSQATIFVCRKLPTWTAHSFAFCASIPQQVQLWSGRIWQTGGWQWWKKSLETN